ncbi:helix-turn-helix domain-containing protein [Jannaschia aquimarina]|uniref:XylR_1 protein n=1 Tax=Jannaschia aquimarina TaxID=935700 RepID=A0A0D1CTV6_9RHOB|nr:AraC family transcriptional regulator [Jannaschia aquimarina]KIT18202.1 Xylose operon regulatory protein [Jannaschia aquimarina]SNS83535.1 Helix-turn-helix domain-containing protein [Jannaschia aquimarina]
MTDDYALHVPESTGAFLHRATPKAHHCDLTGLSIVALPPGRIDVELRSAPGYINVIPQTNANRVDRFIVDDRDLLSRSVANRGGGFDLFAGGLDHEISGENFGWELFVELDETQLPQLAVEAWDGEMRITRRGVCRSDFAVSNLARLAIEHMRQGITDRLYVEGLSIAIVARCLAQASDLPETVTTSGTDARIARAIDYVEAHLGEGLSVAAIASAAAMSPSWFQTAFKATTGQPVFAYVRERRLERARLLLADRRLSLTQIAFACGFSSHSHMTRLFSARYGASPREMR